ncbi:MAG: hypothetical protein MJE77_24825 [Proteobacteria bacterium]|nr:hypothetical protein [Pseudomonadota bacterium]
MRVWRIDESDRIVTPLDKTVRIWNADGTGQPVILRGHSDTVWSALFSPDGERVVSASADKSVRIWSDLDSLEPGDPRLWTATTYCMPVALRQHLLGTDRGLAHSDRDACMRRVRQPMPVASDARRTALNRNLASDAGCTMRKPKAEPDNRIRPRQPKPKPKADSRRGCR